MSKGTNVISKPICNSSTNTYNDINKPMCSSRQTHIMNYIHISIQ